VQRTEIVLRVNAATSDVASQTDILEDTEQDSKLTELSFPESRKKLPEEIECEELSKDLASQLSPNDKLVPILGERARSLSSRLAISRVNDDPASGSPVPVISLSARPVRGH